MTSLFMGQRGGSAERLSCQVCGRRLVPLKDGTSRNHVARPGAEDYCQGSGYRLARCPVGQRLRHHGGSVWEVVEDRERVPAGPAEGAPGARWSRTASTCTATGGRPWPTPRRQAA